MVNQIGPSPPGSAVFTANSGRNVGGALQKQKNGKEITPAYLLELSGAGGAAGIPDTLGISGVENYRSSSLDALRRVVEKLISRQGHVSAVAVKIEISGVTSPVGMTQAEAAAAISENGEWGVNAVSDRIVSFAKALADNDPARIETLRAAIDRGFAGAKEALGTLPDICTQTYDAVMSKLDEWAAEADTATEA